MNKLIMDNLTKTISKNEYADSIVWIPENRASSSIEDNRVEHLGNAIKDDPEDPFADNEELLQIEAPPVSTMNDPLADYSGLQQGLVCKLESAEEKPYSLILKDIDFACNRCSFTTRWFRCLNKHWEEHRKTSQRVLSSDSGGFLGDDIDKCNASFEEEFKCPYCRLVTASEQGLQVHMARQHVLLSDYTCCDCGKSLSSTTALLYHRRLHHPATMHNINCPYCHLISPSVDQLSRHVNKKHTLDGNHKCNRCEFSSCEFKDLALHNSKCLTKEIQNCDFCVSSLISFQIHKCEKNETIGKCPFCEFDSDHVEELLTHFSENHLDMRIKSCSFCKFSCTLTEELKAHIIDNHPDYRFCEFCVVHLEHLVVHMRETHLVDNAIYKCTNCWYSSYFYENLITHIDNMHPSLMCLHCSSTFDSLVGLILHMKDSHIKCPLCSYIGCDVGELMCHFVKTHFSGLVTNVSKSTLTLTQCFLKKLQEHNKENHSSNRGSSQCKVCNFFTFVVHKLIKWIETDHLIKSDMECEFREKLSAELKSFLSDESQEEFFNCPCCFLCFTSRNHALKHYNNTHNSFSSFTNKSEENFKNGCPYCGFVTPSLVDLKSHIFLFHRNCLFSCQGRCRFTCQSVEKLLEHIKESHNTESSFQCPLCQVEYSTLENLLSHIQLKHADEYECLHCEFNTVNFEDYLLHIYESHGYVYTHRCMFCESSFSNQESLLNHVGSIHIVRRLYKCIYCYYETSYEEQLKSHIKNLHWEKLLKCLKCTFFTPSLKKLDRHIELKHLLRPHLISCSKCNFDTANEWKMITHRKVDHKTNDNYSCYECEFTHPDLSVMKQHISGNHCDKGEFPCTICKYKTRFCHGIMNHLRKIHQKFTLSHLMSEFYVIPNESKIIEIQTEKPSRYECFLCHFKGTSLTNLQNHVIFCHTSKIALISCQNSDCDTVFGCPCCKFLAAKMPKLIKHIGRCHGGKVNALFCRLCGFSSTIITDIVLHVQQKHSKASFISFYIEKEAIRRETYLTHTASTLVNSTFYCYFCNKPDSNRQHLRRHIRSLCFNETESLLYQPNYKCPFCCYEFFSLDDIIQHISKKYFFGVKCLLSIWLFICEQLKIHIAAKHLFFNIHFKCLFCIQCSYLIQEIRRHTRCELCQFSTNYKSKLLEHYKEIHINNDSMVVTPFSSNTFISVPKHSSISCNIDFICDVCSDLSEKLITHIKTEYAVERYLNCILCDKKFDCQIELVNHILREHKNSTYFQCPICSLKNKSMYPIWELIEHILLKHRFIQEYHCYTCQDIFEMISNHFNILHKPTCSHFENIDRKSDKDTPGTAGKQQKKNMKKKSKQDDNLIAIPFDSELIIAHRKDKDFLKCPSCKIEFNSEKEFKDHQDVIGCFKCPKCMDIFENFDNLKTHLEVHKLFYFKCDYCTYSDVETNGFTRHILETHFENIEFIVKICRNNINQVSSYFDSQGIATLQSNGANIKSDSSSRYILNINSQNRVTQLFEFLKSRLNEESFCCYCDDKFNSVVELEVHLSSNHGLCKPRPTTIRSVLSCQFCSPLFGELVKYLTAMYENSKIYQCPYCSKYKNSLLPNLVKHIFNVHHIEGLSCWICKISFINTDALTAHILGDHSGVNVYKCEHCMYKGTNLDTFLQHVNETHLDFKGYKCFECCLLFQTFENNLQHYVENHWSVDCNSSCEHSAFIKSLTNNHVNHVNNKSTQKCPQLNCSECYFFTKTLRNLVSDCNMYREKDKPYFVDSIVSLSVPKYNFQEHKKKFLLYLRNSCKFQCTICNLTMSSVKYVIVHFSENHASCFKINKIINELKPHLNMIYSCLLCGFSMADVKDLKIHIKNKHKNIMKFAVVQKCLQCNFSGTSSEMEAHYRHHPESELLKCSLCDFVCMEPSNMPIHFYKNHSDLCECPFCDYSTRKAKCFINHIQNHYNIFYKCPICDQLINSITTLVKHIKSKHRDLMNTDWEKVRIQPGCTSLSSNEIEVIDLVESDSVVNKNHPLIRGSQKQAKSRKKNVNPLLTKGSRKQAKSKNKNVKSLLIKGSQKPAKSPNKNVYPSLIKDSHKQAYSHAENVNFSLIKDYLKQAYSSDENVNSSLIKNSHKQANENVNPSLIIDSEKPANSPDDCVNPSLIMDSEKQAYSYAQNVNPSVIKYSHKQAYSHAESVNPSVIKKQMDLLNTDWDEVRIQPGCTSVSNNEIEMIDLVESDSDETGNTSLIMDSEKPANSPDDSVNPTMIKNSHKQAYSYAENLNPPVIKVSHKQAYSHAENVNPSVIKKHMDLLNTDWDEVRIQPGCTSVSNNEIEMIDLVESDSDETVNPSLIMDSEKPANSPDDSANPSMIKNSHKQAYSYAENLNPPVIKVSHKQAYSHAENVNPPVIKDSHKEAYSHAENVKPSVIKKHRDPLNTDWDEVRIQPGGTSVSNNEIEVIDLVEPDSNENVNPSLTKDSQKPAKSSDENVNSSMIKNSHKQANENVSPSLIMDSQKPANSPDDSVCPSMIKNSHKQAYSYAENVNPPVIKDSHKQAHSHAENVNPSVIKKHMDLLNTDWDEVRIQPGCTSVSNNEMQVIDLVESDSDENVVNPSLIKGFQNPAKTPNNNVNPLLIKDSQKQAYSHAENVNPLMIKNSHKQANSPDKPLSIKNSSGKKYNCSKCLNYITECRRKMIKHLKNHDKVKLLNEIKSVTSEISGLRKCPLCGFKPAKHQNNIIRDHINAVHAINGTLKCTVCNFCTENVDEMYLHSHSLGKPLLHSHSLFSCKMCRYRTRNLNLFNTHLDTKHRDFALERSQEINSGALLKSNYQDLSTTKQVEHKCPQCNFIYRKPEELTVHTEENHTHQYECLHCPFRCSLLTNFNTHRQENHQDSKLYACSHCKFMAIFPGEINLHVTEVHSDIGIQECLLCKLQFAVLNELIHHMATTHGKKYENVIHCLDCRLLFISVAEYTSHFLQVHVTNENTQSVYVIVKLHKLVQNIISSADTGKTDINAYMYMLGNIIKQGTPDSVGFCSDCEELTINLSNHVLSTHTNCTEFVGKSILHKRSSIYKCQYCEFSFFKSFKLLLNHMNESHVEDKCVSCLQLSKMFVKHIKKTHCNKSFKCSYCEFITIKKENFDLHFKKFHCFSCIKCNFVHESRTSLEEHMYTNHLLKKCPHCSYRSHKMDEFKKHMKHNHGDGKKAGCNECGLRFHTIKQMLGHVKRIHRSGLKIGSVYKCPKCEYTAKSFRLLLKHKNCLTPMMKCSYCNVRRFRSYENLNKHLYEKHKVHQFTCSWCSFHCLILQDFEKHMTDNHTDATNHVCPHCGHKTNLRSFILHIQKFHDLSIKTNNKIRITNKPLKVCTIYKCLVCDYSCSKTRELKLHVQGSHEIVCPSGISKLQNKEEDNLLPFNGSIINTKICLKSENPLENSHHCNSSLTEEGIKRRQLNFQYFCLICNASKTTLTAINNHTIERHCKEGFWVCNQCNYISESPSEMSDHFHDLHYKEIFPFVCNWCGFKTSHLISFQTHIRNAHALKAHQKYSLFICSLCNHGYKRLRDLINHFEHSHLSILGDSLYNPLFYIQFFLFKNLSFIIKDVNKKIAYLKTAQETEKSNDLNVDSSHLKMTKECDQAKRAMHDEYLNEEECNVKVGTSLLVFEEEEIEGEEDMTDSTTQSKELSQAQPVKVRSPDSENYKILDEAASDEESNVRVEILFFKEEEKEEEEDMADCTPSKKLTQAQPVKEDSLDTEDNKVLDEGDSEEECDVKVETSLLVFEEEELEGEEDVTDCTPSKELSQAQPVKVKSRDTENNKILDEAASDEESNVRVEILFFKEEEIEEEEDMTDCTPSKELSQAQTVKEASLDTEDNKVLDEGDSEEECDVKVETSLLVFEEEELEGEEDMTDCTPSKELPQAQPVKIKSHDTENNKILDEAASEEESNVKEEILFLKEEEIEEEEDMTDCTPSKKLTQAQPVKEDSLDTEDNKILDEAASEEESNVKEEILFLKEEEIEEEEDMTDCTPSKKLTQAQPVKEASLDTEDNKVLDEGDSEEECDVKVETSLLVFEEEELGGEEDMTDCTPSKELSQAQPVKIKSHDTENNKILDEAASEEESNVKEEILFLKEEEIEEEEDMTDCTPSKKLTQAQPVKEASLDTEDNKVLDEGDSEEECDVKVETSLLVFEEEELGGEEDMTDCTPSKELSQAQPVKVKSRDTENNKILDEAASDEESNVVKVETPFLFYKEEGIEGEEDMTDCTPSKELSQAQPVKEETCDTEDSRLLQDIEYVENIDNVSFNHGINNDITYCNSVKNKPRTIEGVLKGNHKSLLEDKIIKTKHNYKRKSLNTQHIGLSKKHVKFDNNLFSLERHENKFKCMECSFGCQLEMEMEEHIRKYHENKFFCPNCKDSFSSLCEFNLHIKGTHNNSSIYHCPHCKFVSTNLKEIIAHTYTDHSHFVFHFCSLCNFKSTNLEILMTHVEKKHSRIEKLRLMNCALCNYRTKNKKEKELSLHIREHHSNCTPYVCPYCDERSPILKEHLKHISGNHSKANSMEETVFLKVAKCKNEQSKIKSTDNDSGLFKCPHCEFNTSNFVGLRHHMLECRSGSSTSKEIKNVKNKTFSKNKVPLWNLALLKSVKK